MTELSKATRGCKYELAWIGKCNHALEAGEDFCPTHKGKKCDSCGEQATGECDETLGGFVCNTPVCSDCEHEIAPNGTNGMSLKHCRKDAQKYKPWFSQEQPPTPEPPTKRIYRVRGLLLEEPHSFQEADKGTLGEVVAAMLELSPAGEAVVSIKKEDTTWASHVAKYGKSIDGEE
jgi:hypothetical protein